MMLTGGRRSGPRQIPRATIDYLGGELAFSDAVAAFRQAKDAHSRTEGVAAPIAHPLVEEVVNRYGAEFEIVEPPPVKPAPPPVEQEMIDGYQRLVGDQATALRILTDLSALVAKQAGDITFLRNEIDRLSPLVPAVEAIEAKLAVAREELADAREELAGVNARA